MATTGLRRGELMAIKWTDIDFNSQTLTVARALKRGNQGANIGHTKTKTSARTVSLDDAAIVALNIWRQKQATWFSQQQKQIVGPDVWVFSSRDDPIEYLSENTPRRWMVELSDEYNIRRITLHGLRHTKATLLAEAGANPQDIAAILGHTNGKFTMAKYIHPTRSGVQAAETLFDEFTKTKSS